MFCFVYYFASQFTPGSCCSIFSFLRSVLQIIVCVFILFLLATVLTVVRRLIASDHVCGMFKLFLKCSYTPNRGRYYYFCFFQKNTIRVEIFMGSLRDTKYDVKVKDVRTNLSIYVLMYQYMSWTYIRVTLIIHVDLSC